MWAMMRRRVCGLRFRDGTPSGGPEVSKHSILLGRFGFGYLVYGGFRIFLLAPKPRGFPVDCSGLVFVNIP
jgi:hypothetical protein